MHTFDSAEKQTKSKKRVRNEVSKSEKEINQEPAKRQRTEGSKSTVY